MPQFAHIRVTIPELLNIFEAVLDKDSMNKCYEAVANSDRCTYEIPTHMDAEDGIVFMYMLGKKFEWNPDTKHFTLRED